MKNRIRLTAKFVFLIFFATSFSLSAEVNQPVEKQKEEQDTSKIEPSSKDKDNDDVEVIGVVGEKPLAYFRKQMEIAELDFYDLFNELADEEKFKIKCRKEKRTGSHIREKVCYPQYLLDRFAEETQDALSSGRPLPTLKDVEALVKKEREASNAYAEKIITENPKLLKKLIALNNLQASYEQKKAEK